MFEKLKSNIQGKYIRIVFPEGNEGRILQAVKKLTDDKLIKPVLIGNNTEIEPELEKYNISFNNVEIINPETFSHKAQMLKLLVDLREGKNSISELNEWVNKPNYFATLLVKMGYVDGMVGGVTYATKDIVKPSLQIIKTKPDINKVSSIFIAIKEEKVFFLSDCAIIEEPSANDLAEITTLSANFVKKFGYEPKASLLSYSTKGSAAGPKVQKVVDAVTILDNNNVDFLYDGEHQLDAAVISEVKAIKDKHPRFEGTSNLLIFPDLQAANIGYKIMQRFGGYKFVGPILMGLALPVNDLSRGCIPEEIYDIAVITANQVLEDKNE